MSNFQFKAKLYGVRGSYPVSMNEGTEIGGNTACLLVRTQENIVIIDAGSGIIRLGKDLVPEILKHKEENTGPFHITILFTHTHTDHLLGLPFFAPLYFPNVHVHFIGPATLGVDLEQILRTPLDPQYFPVSMDELQSAKSFHNINENMFIYFNPDSSTPKIGKISKDEGTFSTLVIYTMKYYFHPKDGCYLYRIEWQDKKLVFATDVEEYVGSDQRLINFSREADVLIHDAQYTPEQYTKFSGYGHSSYVMACDAARKANVKKLLLYHHDPNNSDEMLRGMEKEAKKLFAASELATEQWEWVL